MDDPATNIIVGIIIFGVVMLIGGSVFPWLQGWFFLGIFGVVLFSFGAMITGFFS